MLFVGDDWSEDHHDVEIQDEAGRKLAARRLPEGAAGLPGLQFGRYTNDSPSFTGRRVDMLGRSLNVPLDAEPVTVLPGYLSTTRTESASELAAKAVVLISPEQLAGKVAWPHTGALH